MNRLIFISNQNRWFFHLAWLTSILAFAVIMLNNFYLSGTFLAIIVALTGIAATLHRHFTYRAFQICCGMLLLLGCQLLLNLFASKYLISPANNVIHVLFGLVTISLLWGLCLTTRPNSYFQTHTSLKKIRPWATLGLLAVIMPVLAGD